MKFYRYNPEYNYFKILLDSYLTNHYGDEDDFTKQTWRRFVKLQYFK